MESGFNWEGSYNEFVEFDKTNWKDMVGKIPLPLGLSFTNVLSRQTMNKYLTGDCGLLALSLNKLSGWPIYGVSENAWIPAHYILKAPGGEYFLDVEGFQPTCYLTIRSTY